MSARPKTGSMVGRGVFAILCAMGFIMYIDRTNISVAAPLFKGELKLSNTELGSVFSLFAVAYACCGIPGAWLIDRIGPRRGMTAFGVVWSLATVATGQISTLGGLLTARFAVGVGEAPIYASAARVIATWIPAHRRGAAQGAMHGSGRLANALAPLVVGALITVFAWRTAFVVLGVITLLFFVVFHWFIRDDPALDPRVGPAELEALGPALPPPGQGKPLHWPTMLRRIWPATVACFSHGWVLWFFNNWIPSYFSQRYGMDIGKSALFSTLVLLGGTLGTLAGGMLTDWRFRSTGNRLRARRDVIVFGFLASILGLLPLLFTDDLRITAIALGCAFFLSELSDSPLWLLGAEIMPGHAGTASATVFAGMAIAGAVSPLIIGGLLDATGGNWSYAFAASILVLMLGPIFAFFIRLDPSLDSSDGPKMPDHFLLRTNTSV